MTLLTSNIGRVFTADRPVSVHISDVRKKYDQPFFWRDSQRFSGSNYILSDEIKNTLLPKNDHGLPGSSPYYNTVQQGERFKKTISRQLLERVNKDGTRGIRGVRFL